MQKNRQNKPGDNVFRPRRVRRFRLKRALGIAGLFSAGYGNIGSSIYYALGIVAIVALGATPIALAAAGILYIFNALTYAEGSAMLPEGGGSASYARLGFNNLTGFASGWALMLSYIVTLAISAYTIPPYLGYFWPVLHEPLAGTLASMGIILFLMIVNIIGVKESAKLNIFFISVDIITQIILVVLGLVLILIPNPQVLFQNMFGEGNWPSTANLIFGIALASLCFTGVETVSQLAEETRQPQRRIPQTYIMMIVVVLLLFAGISLVALSTMTPQMLGDPVNGWARDPVAGIAQGIAQLVTPAEMAARISAEASIQTALIWIFTGVRDFLPVLVAILAASILLTATNAGLLGISRLTYHMATNNQLPDTLSKIHYRFRTPYLAIAIFSVVALLMLIPGFFNRNFFAVLGSLYVFGSLLTFALAHAGILALRIRQPQLPRPFKLGLNFKISGKELPLTAILGLVSTLAVWIVIIIVEPTSRLAGAIWMGLGLVFYYSYMLYQKRSKGKESMQEDAVRKNDSQKKY